MFAKSTLWIVALSCVVARLLLREPLLSAALEITAGIAAFSAVYLQRKALLYAGSFAVAAVGVALFVYGENPIAIFAGWEAVSVAGWALIAFGRGASRRSMEAALIAFLTNRAGDVFWLAGLFSEGKFPEGIWLGVLIKAGVFPFSFWLVQAMFAPAPVSALLHSAVIVGLGAYLPLKYPALTGSAPSPWIQPALWGAGMLAGIGAVLSRSSKGTLAWTTAAHLAIALSLSGTPTMGLPYLLHHSYLKASLFLTLGIAQKAGGFSLPLSILWGAGGLLLPLLNPIPDIPILIIETLTALALGRAWRRTGVNSSLSLGVPALLIIPVFLIGRVLTTTPSGVHVSWELLGVVAGFLTGASYGGAFSVRLDKAFLYVFGMLLQAWLGFSRLLAKVETLMQRSLESIANAAVRVGRFSAAAEERSASVGWRYTARHVRQAFGMLSGEGAAGAYTQALSWGFLLTLIASMIWKVLR